MRLAFDFVSAALLAVAAVSGSPLARQNSEYVGYLISTFSDPVPHVQWHLSDRGSPSEFSFLNRGQPVLTSTVGTRGVRDIYLTTNSARSEYFIIATDLDINAPGFSWGWAVTQGSKSLVIWRSTNLVDWSGPNLVRVEEDVAGMAWAPSAVWVEDESQYYVFWSSRIFEADDPGHTGPGSLHRIRYATTQDFVTFSEPRDYASSPETGLIDQEFQYLGTPNHYARFLKNENLNQMYQEISTNGLFGPWTRTPGFVADGSPWEGLASYADLNNPDVYYCLLDNYNEYVPFTTTDIRGGAWQRADWPSFPRGLKHGAVFPVTEQEYARIAQRYG